MKTKQRRIKKSWARKAEREQVVAPLPQPKDIRPITIIGRDQAGNVLAEDHTDSNWKANQIAAAWKASGLAVDVIETEAPSEAELAGLTGQGSPSGEVLGHPEASVGA